MEKKNVAIVHYMFGCGGAEHVVAELAEGIDKNRFNVDVVCIYGSKLNNDMERRVSESGAMIHYLGHSKCESALMGVIKVWQCLSRLKPSVVHTHLGAVQYCLPWAIAHDIKLLHTIHNVPDKEVSGSHFAKLMSFLYRKKIAVPVTISRQNQLLTANYYSLPLNYVELINNPVDTAFFCLPPSSMEIDFDFINVAGLRKQKNQRNLLEAFAAVVERRPGARLAIVGDGSERDSLVEYADTLDIASKVTFVGQVNEKLPLRSYLWRSRVFVLSSDYEGLPLAALEAMSCGLPVVSTDVGGMSDLVSGNGQLVPAADSKALADAMLYILDNLNCRDDMKTISREIASDYDSKICVGKYERLYESCIITK